eukprot:gnl/TRDRNA2_/TRDRNA2_204985_c0_seq1.p1 gnl/TRDRNA2_/TRDRNA2_204985_c0~~gnl/TRDRNA2_/TRDRNA2_204985_c0_seq1.p1  ORF type:complete len:147 (+),score=10.14 gnl/TRDRNA2_/TRDRNA2_204985_c0_seq1:140-580(+)
MIADMPSIEANPTLASPDTSILQHQWQTSAARDESRTCTPLTMEHMAAWETSSRKANGRPSLHSERLRMWKDKMSSRSIALIAFPDSESPLPAYQARAAPMGSAGLSSDDGTDTDSVPSSSLPMRVPGYGELRGLLRYLCEISGDC